MGLVRLGVEYERERDERERDEREGVALLEPRIMETRDAYQHDGKR